MFNYIKSKANSGGLVYDFLSSLKYDVHFYEDRMLFI